ncbi:hypothetical protein HOLleu_09270 [Holothuria leucospilota]|uniref:Uncharacterized protein n=1 Tax=Holothuria leucospilota TaxID=206669 RepID=A0A9Q1HE09_HOLLE|nr:hypothetical protein HOLleu_09270 [Holothuria leucospilota]
MALFGKIDTFHGDKEQWTQYIERLTHYFVVNDIKDEEKQKSILLSVIGSESYKLLRNLLSPVKPGEKKFKELVEVMARHLNPTPSEIVQQFKFNSRVRKTG